MPDDEPEDEPNSDPIQAVGLTSLGDPSGEGTLAAMVFVVVYEVATTAVRAARDLIHDLASRRRARD